MWPSRTISAVAGACSFVVPSPTDVFSHLRAASAQQTGELILRQRIGYGRDRAEHGGRVGAERDGDRKRLDRD